jgi:hypothetical protein
MSMIYVLEIKATAVLAFEAEDMDDARAYASNAGELEDLEDLRSNGAPLWNGRDKITVRPATEAEANLFEEQREEDWEDEPHADAEDFAVFLVPLDEPEEE